MDHVSSFTEVQGWFCNPASLLLVQTSFNINETRHKNRHASGFDQGWKSGRICGKLLEVQFTKSLTIFSLLHCFFPLVVTNNLTCISHIT